ncbi:MAG: hypothetical protein J1F12_08855 [Muribaculaceae bacterium]|nr:hypothetical protein [Muribaculaceae bacterium]
MYHEEEFKFNPEILSKERPIGVSGLMRVKNEERFLSLSVESVIEALDELIIVYQKSEDRTAEIAEEKRKQYPDKIKVFFYEPEIKSHKLSDQEFEEQCKLPKDSIHLLANYYNYTLSKATYRYALKIDADQIYNTVKLKEICDLYRSQEKTKISIKENLTGLYFNLITIICFQLSIRFKIKFLKVLPISLYNYYLGYARKKIQNDKITSSLSGLNLFIKDREPYLLYGAYENNSFPPFNGVNDHLIFPINPKSFYLPAYSRASKSSKYGKCIIERFNWDSHVFKPKGLSHKLVHLGFVWYHVAPLSYKNLKLDKIFPFMVYDNFSQCDFVNLKDSLSNHRYNRSRIWMWWYWQNWSKQSNPIKKNWATTLKKIIVKNPS